MKMRKIIVLAMTVLLFTGCGDSTSLEEKRVNNDSYSEGIINGGCCEGRSSSSSRTAIFRLRKRKESVNTVL